MEITITLTLLHLLGVVYIIGSLMTSAAFVLDELSFVNPQYWKAVVAGFTWPLLLVQVLILARFDVYIGDEINKFRRKFN